jgi:hypothetical protein
MDCLSLVGEHIFPPIIIAEPSSKELVLQSIAKLGNGLCFKHLLMGVLGNVRFRVHEGMSEVGDVGNSEWLFIKT